MRKWKHIEIKWFVIIIGIRVNDYINQGEENILFKQEDYPEVSIIPWTVFAAHLESATICNLSL